MIRSALIAFSLTMPLFFVASLSASAATSPAMKSCSDEWKKEKEAGTVPEGQTWPKFWSQCSKDYAAAHGTTDESAAPPPEEPKTKKANKTKAVAVNEDESTGTSAADKKACDAKWNDHKSSSGAHGWKAYFTFMAKCMP